MSVADNYDCDCCTDEFICEDTEESAEWDAVAAAKDLGVEIPGKWHGHEANVDAVTSSLSKAYGAIIGAPVHLGAVEISPRDLALTASQLGSRAMAVPVVASTSQGATSIAM